VHENERKLMMIEVSEVRLEETMPSLVHLRPSTRSVEVRQVELAVLVKYRSHPVLLGVERWEPAMVLSLAARPSSSHCHETSMQAIPECNDDANQPRAIVWHHMMAATC